LYDNKKAHASAITAITITNKQDVQISASKSWQLLHSCMKNCRLTTNRQTNGRTHGDSEYCTSIASCG